jgi:hypothetical protein
MATYTRKVIVCSQISEISFSETSKRFYFIASGKSAIDMTEEELMKYIEDNGALPTSENVVQGDEDENKVKLLHKVLSAVFSKGKSIAIEKVTKHDDHVQGSLN